MYELVRGHLHPLLSQSVSTNCVLARMQSCMKNRRTGQNNFEQLFSLGKTRTKAYVSINPLPIILSVAQGGTRHTHRPCPSVLRAACLILQPVLVKFRSRHPRQQLSSHPPPRSDGHSSYSPVSYAFSLIWLCVQVFQVRIYYFSKIQVVVYYQCCVLIG